MKQINVLWVAILIVSGGCARSSDPTRALRTPQPLEADHLHNVYRVHARVISGGQPDGEAAFGELRSLGIKTVISVDGAKPHVELARKYGLRYVHLPHGYDGVPESRARELAKAVRDLPGPVYIHCHHGRHRSPTAAAVACVGAGILDRAEALTVLQAAGTSKKYRGLYGSAKKAQRFDAAILDKMDTDFPEMADVPAMADAMVAIERTFDNLKAIEQANWKTPPDHPDLDPPHVALLLREHYAELLRMEETRKQPVQFQQLLRESESAAIVLETSLRKGDGQQQGGILKKSFAQISADCGACHRKFRDVPLGLK